MIIHLYDVHGLYITSIEIHDSAQIPVLSTFLPPPDVTPNESPYAVFRNGVWSLEQNKPTMAIYSTLPGGAELASFQAKAVLSQYGLLDQVQSLMNDQDTPVIIRLAWENAVPFRRDNPLVLLIAQQLSLSVVLLDELFSVGARITADL